MAKDWGGKTYDEDWNEIDAMGNRIGGGKDWAANAGYAAATNTQNPYTNQAGASQWDKTGLVPSNQPGSTLAPVTGGAAAGAGTAAGSDWQGLNDAIMGGVKKDIGLTGVVDQTNPAYQQQVQANQLQTNLAADRARAAMMQRRAATGTGTSGAVDTDVNKVLEQQAYQDKTFEGQLLDKFRQQDLDARARALQLGGGMLTAEQERQLRGALTREGYDVQRDLAADDLAYRRDALGQQLALSQAELDQRAMLSVLGGGA